MQAYDRVKDLGEGGYGKALLCRRKSDRQLVVIKEVRLAGLSARDRQEATQEAAVLGSLRHPNIVSYFGSFYDRGAFYIVMEFADGGDLAQKIQKRGSHYFTEEDILHDFVQIALALKYVHDRKILHRDLKTQNVFLTKSGRVKLGDFGIARCLDNTLQFCRTKIGTPFYLSPEICEGRNYNSKSDMWSLGCILYELATLKHPFDGPNMPALMQSIIHGRFAPIGARYSDDLKALIADLLSKDPERRPSINELLSIPFIQARLGQLLDQAVLDVEFSHTILHGQKPLQPPSQNPNVPPQKPMQPPSQNPHVPPQVPQNGPRSDPKPSPAGNRPPDPLSAANRAAQKPSDPIGRPNLGVHNPPPKPPEPQKVPDPTGLKVNAVRAPAVNPPVPRSRAPSVADEEQRRRVLEQEAREQIAEGERRQRQQIEVKERRQRMAEQQRRQDDDRRQAVLAKQREAEARQRADDDAVARKRDEGRVRRREAEEAERRCLEEANARAQKLAEEAKQRREEEQARAVKRELLRRADVAEANAERSPVPKPLLPAQKQPLVQPSSSAQKQPLVQPPVSVQKQPSPSVQPPVSVQKQPSPSAQKQPLVQPPVSVQKQPLVQPPVSVQKQPLVQPPVSVQKRPPPSVPVAPAVQTPVAGHRQARSPRGQPVPSVGAGPPRRSSEGPPSEEGPSVGAPLKVDGLRAIEQARQKRADAQRKMQELRAEQQRLDGGVPRSPIDRKPPWGRPPDILIGASIEDTFIRASASPAWAGAGPVDTFIGGIPQPSWAKAPSALPGPEDTFIGGIPQPSWASAVPDTFGGPAPDDTFVGGRH
jgi:NIMA (never in mitosis gene a)-related kinase